jgi:hypothetical protein
MRLFLTSIAILICTSVAFAQKYDPPAAKTPDAATLNQIEERTAKLKEAVAAAAPKIPEIHRADLEVYVKAAEWIMRHQEWYTADSGKQTLAVIEQGIKRAESAKDGKTPWLEPKGKSVARGYRSKIDDSVQPYGVVYPVGYGDDPKKKWRIDVFLHGRDSTITEVKYLNQYEGRQAPKDQDFIQLNIYGRGNNAYRWAGESDVMEVLLDFMLTEARLKRDPGVDLDKIVLKGFSMGGAGTWHIGLRHPDYFAVIQPGAGFTTTHGYIAKLPETLPDYQEKCLRIYDAYRYAENAFNLPIVAYSGEIDPQKKAADNIQTELKQLGLADRMVHLIGPGLEHRFPPEWQKKAEEEIRARVGESGRARHPERIRFVTYTLKNASCAWIQIEGLERHYEPATVDATWDGDKTKVDTTNVSRLVVSAPGKNFPKSIRLNGKDVAATDAKFGSCAFEKSNNGWKASKRDPAAGGRTKTPDLQGPIDDAFSNWTFLCVVGTGKPLHAEMHNAAVAQLERFHHEWDKYMRGSLPVKKDTEVTEEDRRRKNLILFGDPGSNKLIAETLKKLPIDWTADTLEFGGTKYDPGTHLPVMIQPSPFGYKKYIVLNSGHTFHEADFKGTNALLYPRLGDYAVVKPTPTEKDPAAFEVITAGLFDENWQFPKK